MEDIHLNFSNLIMINIYLDTDYHNDAIQRNIIIRQFLHYLLTTHSYRNLVPFINPQFISIQYNEWQH